MTAFRSKSPQTASDGFIVVAVLWILGALATLASVYAVYVANTAMALAVNDDGVRAEALVSAALELTAYQLNVKEEVRPAHGEFRFRLSRANVAASFRSEGARIDLNAAPKELLAGLFASLGARPDDALSYADRIIAWRQGAPAESPEEDKEPSAYRSAGLNYLPRGAPFPHVGELWLVLGLPPALVERAIPLVTVYSGRAEINVLEAPPEIVAALPGMTSDRLYTVLRQRAAAPQDAQTLISLLGPAQAMTTIEATRATRVTVRISFDNGRRMASEVVILPNEDGYSPFGVLSWRDDIDEGAADQRTGVGSR
ncbi:MAG: ral secretion pathway protein [Alphaproteobacteria bacterium]|jgi:general secretion pathway protein K|nr:ral secretion pathway protein [Alphaproteobacteria bacterium]